MLESTAEEAIDVDDLPNFRFDGATEFDVTGESAADAPDFSQYEIPDVIRSFVVYFQKNLRDQNVYEVHSIYENSFNKLTDRYYKNTPWPPAEVISPLVNGDQQFLLLYRELCYRHIYAKLQPTLEQRFDSWANYCDIFNLLLSAEVPIPLELPNQWLWDMIDEFIYQYQAFCQYRARTKKNEEVQRLRDAPHAWSVHKVLYYLHALADKACIMAQLQGESVDSKFASSSLYKMLAHFALVGLLRIHCLLADYQLALSIIAPIDLSKKGLFTRVTACHISIFYYVGFAYLMLRRYADATKTFSSILFYIGRTKQYHTRSYQYEQILKKNEQMCAQRHRACHAVMRPACASLANVELWWSCPQVRAAGDHAESVSSAPHRRESTDDSARKVRRADGTHAGQQDGHGCIRRPFLLRVPQICVTRHAQVR
tara:strand:- start:617 stop:1897 length:1281 start_codon:yes stop_codon:yes gene_type:complete